MGRSLPENRTCFNITRAVLATRRIGTIAKSSLTNLRRAIVLRASLTDVSESGTRIEPGRSLRVGALDRDRVGTGDR